MTIIAVQRSKSCWQCWLLLAALLSGIAMLASGSPTPEAVERPAQISTWRRTRDGWERPRWLVAKQPRFAAPLHPLCVAVLTILLAGMGLIGYSPRVAPAIGGNQ